MSGFVEGNRCMVFAIVCFSAIVAFVAILWVFLYNKVVKKDMLCEHSWEQAHHEIWDEAQIARQVKDVLQDRGEAEAEVSELSAAIVALEDASDTPETLAASESLSQALKSSLGTLSQTTGLSELTSKITTAGQRSSEAKKSYLKAVSDFNHAIEEFPTRFVAEPRFRKRDFAVAEA